MADDTRSTAFWWETANDGGSFAYSDKKIIGHVAPIRAATRWSWMLYDASDLKHQPSMKGRSATEAGAKREFRRALGSIRAALTHPATAEET